MDASTTISRSIQNLPIPRRAAAHVFTTAAILLGLSARLVTPAGADVPALPASDYPAQTKLTYFPTWTNQQFDCNFGWFCDTQIKRPFFHVFTEDQLHRTGGWAMWGEWHGDRMGFELYSSLYSDQPGPGGRSWNQIAADDERMALRGLQRARASGPLPRGLSDGAQSGAFAERLDRAGWHILFLTVWWGNANEIEAAVMHPPKLRLEARRFLAMEVRAAVQLAGAS